MVVALYKYSPPWVFFQEAFATGVTRDSFYVYLYKMNDYVRCNYKKLIRKILMILEQLFSM